MTTSGPMASKRHEWKLPYAGDPTFELVSGATDLRGTASGGGACTSLSADDDPAE